MNRNSLIKKLVSLGIKVTTLRTVNGFEDKILFPDISENVCPVLKTYFVGDTECIKLFCEYNPTSFSVTSVDTVLFYYSYLLKIFKIRLALIKDLADKYTVNKSLQPIDLYCWRKGWIILVIDFKHSKVTVT